MLNLQTLGKKMNINILLCLAVIVSSFYTLNVSAEKSDFRIKISPENPIHNETFDVEFIIKVENGDNPVINFDPLGLSVVSKSQLGTSTRVTYINGESNVEKTITIGYVLMAKQIGTTYLRNITAEIDGKTLRHKTKVIRVLKEARKQKNIFVRAEVDKQTAFIGEAIIVRYYLYNKSTIPLVSTDIKKFPKLDKFLKRFHQEKLNRERVRFNGEIFDRRIMYTAQLYAQKSGIFKIDPIMMQVGYSKRNNSFNNFGFNLHMGGSASKLSLRSKPVEVEILDLPAKGMMPHYTGLVGEHQFDLKINKNKFIANEPIEIELTVKGPGALELFEAPILIKHDNIEEFEKSNELEISSTFVGTKQIDYTYLGRGDVDLADITIPLSYFDPESKTYITKQLNLGSIKVIGLNNPTKKNSGNSSDPIVNTPVDAVHEISVNEYQFKPLYKTMNTFLYSIKELLILFIFLIIGTLAYLLYRFKRNFKPKVLSDFDDIYKNGVDYSSLHRILQINAGKLNNSNKSHLSMSDVVDGLSLDSSTTEYFKQLIETFNKQYASDSEANKAPANKKYFKELEKALTKYTEDSLSESMIFKEDDL